MNAKQIGPNATEINGERISVLFSYATPVAARVRGEGWFRTSTRHSVTTSRHINAFLNGVTAAERPQEWFDSLDFTTLTEQAAR